jgi:hypothetical protein
MEGRKFIAWAPQIERFAVEVFCARLQYSYLMLPLRPSAGSYMQLPG